MGSITQHTDPASRRHAREIQGQRSFVLWESWRERTSNLFFGEEKGKNEMWPSTLEYWIKRWAAAAARNPIDTWKVKLSTGLSQCSGWKRPSSLKVPTSAIFVTSTLHLLIPLVGAFSKQFCEVPLRQLYWKVYKYFLSEWVEESRFPICVYYSGQFRPKFLFSLRRSVGSQLLHNIKI